MIQKNDKVSSFQLLLVLAMIGNSLFVGMGTTISIGELKQMTWTLPLIAMVLGIIPILFLNKVMNYEPSLSIFEKNTKLFGKIIGQFINIILLLIALLIIVLLIWGMSNFVSVKYLTETPILFLCLLFIIPLIYGTIKGMESVARTVHILFFASLVIFLIIVTTLAKFMDLDNLKPFLVVDYKTIAISVFRFITYAFTPALALLAIPKNKIVNNKHLSKYLILGYILTCTSIFVMFFTITSVLGYNIISMYRYPEYYVIKKVAIGNAFDNIENFLSVHWIFNMFSEAFLCFFFVKEYIKKVLKIKKMTIINIIVVLLGIILTYVSSRAFKSGTHEVYFMKNYFPLMAGLTFIIILIVSSITIMIKNKFKQ